MLTLSIQQLADGSGRFTCHGDRGGTAAGDQRDRLLPAWRPDGYPGIISDDHRRFTLPRPRGHLAGHAAAVADSDEQPWESWCALQTSYFVVDRGQYNCIPGFGGGLSATGATEMCTAQDSGKDGHIVRTALAVYRPDLRVRFVGARRSRRSTETFDVTFDGDLLTGSAPGTTSA